MKSIKNKSVRKFLPLMENALNAFLEEDSREGYPNSLDMISQSPKDNQKLRKLVDSVTIDLAILHLAAYNPTALREYVMHFKETGIDDTFKNFKNFLVDYAKLQFNLSTEFGYLTVDIIDEKYENEN